MEFEERVLDKLDKIQEDVSDLKEQGAVQTVHIKQNADGLDYHSKRSDMLEQIVETHKADAIVHKKQLTVKDLFIKITFFFGGIGTISGCTYGILKLLEMLK